MRAPTAARITVALLATLILVTGCASGAPTSTGTVSIGDARPSATQSATPSPTRTVSTKRLVKVSYDTWGFTAMRPDTWRSYLYEFIGTLEGTIGYLSNDTLTNPCRRTANSTSCEQQAVVKRLSSDGVLIHWDEIGRPLVESISAFPGDPLRIDGSAARLEKPRSATQDCRVLGGAVQIQGTVRRPDAGENFLQLHACIGPDAGKAAVLDVDALFRSIEFIRG